MTDESTLDTVSQPFKECTICKQFTNNFPIVHSKYYSNSCKDCHAKRRKGYYLKNKDRELLKNKEYVLKNPEKPRQYQIKYLYGISIEEYNILEKKCGICGQEDNLHIDHDHATSIVRGLLCGKCNKAIGLLLEDSEIVLKAFKYLERHGK